MLQHIQETEQDSRTGQELGNSFYVTEGKNWDLENLDLYRRLDSCLRELLNLVYDTKHTLWHSFKKKLYDKIHYK